jgi:predicted DNA-binding transcriptional regulator AlpA
MVREGEAPQPRRFGSRMTRWRTSDVRSFIENGRIPRAE